MSMPADAINAILNGTPSPLHLWVMNETSGTTFADQVASGARSLTAAAGCAPGGWGNIGGRRNVGGPQTPAPSFNGASLGYAQASGATLGGLPLGWGIVMMMDSTLTSLGARALYCERGTSGNDLILFQVNSSKTLTLTVCDDTAAHSVSAATPSTNNAVYGGEGQYHGGGQMLGVSVAANGKCSFFLNGPFGIGTSSQTLNSSHTWTNAGVTTNIGIDPLNTSLAFSGTLCWVAVFGSAFTAAQFNAWYQALTPPPAHGSRWTVAANGTRFPNSAFWNQKLDPAAPVDPNSAARVSQWTSWMTANNAYVVMSPYVPLFSLDATGRSGTGVRTNFQPSADQHAFMLGAATPDTFVTGDPFPSNTSSDAMGWVCQPSTGFQYDLYQGLSSGVAATPSSLTPPYIGTPTASTSSGSLAPGAYFYSASAVNTNGESYAIGGYGQDVKATLTATGQVTLPLTVETTGTPPPTAWKIYRRGPYATGGPFGSTADYQFLTTTTGTPASFTDTGSATPSTGLPIRLTTGSASAPWGTLGTALTSDWASVGGGGSWDYLKNCAFNPCWKPSGNTNNGASASSSPAGAGVITVEEALNGLIPHPIVMAFPSSNNGVGISQHRWPAPRHDGIYNGSGFPLMEGMRLRFPSTFNPTSLTYSTYAPLATFQQALATAIRDYGIVHRDSTVGGGLIYCEDPAQTGRYDWSYIFGGYWSGSTNTANSVTGPIPWGSLQVLMAFRNPSRLDAKGRRTNRLDVVGYPTPVPY